MELLYADKRIAVAVKPPGVLSTDEPGGMPELLRAQLGTPCIRTVHRLDAATGGVIGINGVSSLVGASGEEATLGRLADHMEQIVRVGGEDCLGLGFDFAEKILAPGTSFVVGGNDVRAFDILGTHAGLPKLTEELLRRGWSAERIEKVYGGNFLRVYRQWLK